MKELKNIEGTNTLSCPHNMYGRDLRPDTESEYIFRIFRKVGRLKNRVQTRLKPLGLKR